MWLMVLIMSITVPMEPAAHFHHRFEPRYIDQDSCDEAAIEYSKDLNRLNKKVLPQGTGVYLEVRCEIDVRRPA